MSPREPEFGLVCITHSTAVRYRGLTLSRYKHFPAAARGRILEELYRHNLRVLFRAVEYCAHHRFGLYRIPAALFPLNDLPDGLGISILEGFRKELAWVGRHAAKHGLRMVMHPDQHVVLSSGSEVVVENSVQALENQAQIMDWLGLPRSVWSALNAHGGKPGRAEELVDTILHLPQGVRSRLTLENDERAYGAEEILEVCRRTGTPMVFDAHHHLVREGLDGYDHPSVAHFTARAAETWPRPDWQIVHISNGRTALHDPAHHDLVTALPACFRAAPWLEVEAKNKEYAIAHLRAQWPRLWAAEPAPAEPQPPLPGPLYLGVQHAVEQGQLP